MKPVPSVLTVMRFTVSLRRNLLPALLFLASIGCTSVPPGPPEETPPADLVDPLIDSANSRWIFFSSASRPFGMVNLSPDTRVDGTWGTGYRFNVDTVRGLSHVHAWQLSGVSVLPVVGSPPLTEGKDGYASTFRHDTEEARAGYHALDLDRYGIRVELTSTKRVGVHRYSFPASDSSAILIDVGGQLGPAEMIDGAVRRVSDTEVVGHTVNGPTRRRPKATPLFFVARFDKPMTSFGGWQSGTLVSGADSVSGPDSGARIAFETADGDVVQMKVGLSYVSIEQARLNLETELPGWDFDAVRKASREEWNDLLGRIDIDGGTHEQRVRFYTDLWHALLGRRTISDVDGRYSDMTGKERIVRRVPLDADDSPIHPMYNSDSFWGAQWTLSTLWHLVYPEISEGFVQTMLRMYEDGGLIPRGPSGGNYTFVMTGASSTPFIVSAFMKGIREFDVEQAYQGLRKNHMPGGIMSKAGYEHNTFIGGGMEYYVDRGYIPEAFADSAYGFHQDGAGQTLEYAYQDWCLSEFATILGHGEDAQHFRERARNYANLYDGSTGWMRPRSVDGSWMTPFDSLGYSKGFVEANAVQATWFVPHDVAGLIELMGGRDPFVDRLNRSFERAARSDFVTESDDPEAYVNYGNQPSMQAAFLFNYAGAPWLTQRWSREVVDRVYSDVTPFEGYSGDEDQGLMGALATLMKMGLFQMRGGCDPDPVYEIGSPVFDRITITLHPEYYPGESFVIEANGSTAENRYIRSAELDGRPLARPWFRHGDIIDGGRLVLEMSAEPNDDWGGDPDAGPPSMSAE